MWDPKYYGFIIEFQRVTMSNETAYHLGDSLWDLTDQELEKK